MIDTELGSMTAPTPQQMRALADDVQHMVHNGYEFAPENVVVALRTAADQLDAVDRWLENQYRRGWQTVPDLDALGDILNPNTSLPAVTADHFEAMAPGTRFVADSVPVPGFTYHFEYLGDNRVQELRDGMIWRVIGREGDSRIDPSTIREVQPPAVDA